MDARAGTFHLAAMPFLTEPAPPPGKLPVLPGIWRVVAPNPSVMTYHGTNSWFVAGPDGVTLIDPGPDLAEHVEALVDAAAGPVARILLTHTHADHHGATAALQAATGAPTYGYGTPEFTPDHPLRDGDAVAGLVALHTPGHAADHLCFAAPDGVLFSGDHVMSWSGSVVPPNGGDMAAYFANLRRLLARDDRIYLGGHGPPLPDPHPFVRDLLARRLAREEEIAAAIAARPWGTRELADALYSATHPRLRRATEANVIAHLRKLAGEGRAVQDGDTWRAA